MKNFRKKFLTGLMTLLPLIVSVYVFLFVFRLFDRLIYSNFPFVDDIPTLKRIVEFADKIPGSGFLMTVFLIYLFGILMTNVLAQRIYSYLDKWMSKIPVVKLIYTSVKQIVDAVSNKNSKAFKKVVMFEYPRKGIYSVGFLMEETTGIIREKIDNKDRVNIFLPTTPNPTSGFLLILPKEEIIELDITIEEGIKLIVSGGVVSPDQDLDELKDKGADKGD